MIELANEDALRLNILLRQDVRAIRINESNMTLHALLKDKEAKIKLNPAGNEARYLKQVRELLSSHYLDSPAGFPVFMNRWTRMGQAGSENIYALLKLGEPEAVVYAVNSTDLNEEQASYAWWAMPSMEVALQLLSKQNIAQSPLASELAAFILEFLPFENDSNTVILSVNLLLQNNLLTEEEKQDLWKKGKRKVVYRIGFLQGGSRHLPQEIKAHPQLNDINSKLSKFLGENNTYKALLIFLMSSSGQNYLFTLHHAINKLADQDAAIALFAIMQNFFSVQDMQDTTSEKIQTTELEQEIKALLKHVIKLSQIREEQLIPVLSHTNAVGSVLRNKLTPLTNDIMESISFLIGTKT